MKGSNKIVADIGHEIMEALVKQNVKATEVRMSIVYGDEVNLDDELFDYAFAVGIEPTQTDSVPLKTFGTLEITERAAVTAATIMLHGASAMALLENKVHLQRWALENGYSLCDEMRSIHYRGPMHNVPPEEWVTELRVIVEPPPREQNSL
jgi:hypothetical protein